MSTLRQLFYLSRAEPTLTDMDVRQILQISQRNNRRKEITGCLLYSGKHFAQVLEGDSGVVDELAARIAKDKRHSSYAVVADRQIGVRKFPGWSMGFLYKLDIADRLEALLNGERPSEELALELLNDVNPDTVMGTL